MIKIYEANGTVKNLCGKMTADQIREIIGGYLEQIEACDGLVQMFVDDEGLCKGLPVNHAASRFANRKIVGTVVVLTGRSKILWG
jgi:hypothetical protein